MGLGRSDQYSDTRPARVPDNDSLLAALAAAHPMTDVVGADSVTRGRSTFIELSTAARLMGVVWRPDEIAGEGEI